MKIRKILLCTLLFLTGGIRAGAVFNEKDLPQTLSVLRFELQQENTKMGNSRANLDRKNMSQHREMVDIMKKCNELALILYSQNQDFTFDMTYALKEVTSQYNSFKERRLPYDDIVTRLNLEIERYERLIESLRRLPPALDKISEIPDSLSAVGDSLMLMEPRVLPQEPPREEGHGPFMLDEKSREDRDSCVVYARNLLKMYTIARDGIQEDSEHYEDASARLQESYDYAQERYRILQKRIFVEGQDNYLKILRTLPSYTQRAFTEAVSKYRTRLSGGGFSSKSEWRGPLVFGFAVLVVIFIFIASLLGWLVEIMLSRGIGKLRGKGYKRKRVCLALLCGFLIFILTLMTAGNLVHQNFFTEASKLLLIFAWLVTAILLSQFIRLDSESINNALFLYLPVVALGAIVVLCRIVFIPNRLANLILPPLLVIFFFWQLRMCRKSRNSVKRDDLNYAWATLFAIGATAVISLVGYVLPGIQIFMWWLFQLAAIETLTAISDILDTYRKHTLANKMEAFAKENPFFIQDNGKGAYISVTWLFDFMKMTVLPVLDVLSVPLCIWFAADMFDLSEICRTGFYKSFFNLSDTKGNEILHLSMYKLVIVSSLFFVFNYANYASKAFYRQYKLAAVARKNRQEYIHANQVNLTLANNVLGILIWGAYVIQAVMLMKIPMGAISIVAAGLATGIGLALKDVLNNFIYGIQLMSGRLRVGDYVECDGVRGKVESITYQSTQIETIDGAVMSVTNTSLFNKNFQNLTRNNSYECVKIAVGVSYGTDVAKVRNLLTEKLKVLQTTDKYGRAIVDPARGISLVFNGFGDSSVDLLVKQYVLVEEEPAYIARAREIIYNALNEADIEIPFPQADVHIFQ